MSAETLQPISVYIYHEEATAGMVHVLRTTTLVVSRFQGPESRPLKF